LALTLFVGLECWYWTTYSLQHDPLLPCLCTFFRRSLHPVIPDAILVEKGNALRLLDRHDDEAVRLLANQTPGESVIAHIMTIPHARSVGFLAPVIETTNHSMRITPRGRPLTPAETTMVRSMYSAFLKTQWSWAGPRNQEHANLLALGDGISRRIRWGGLLHDVLAAPIVGLWVWSLLLLAGPNASWRRAERRRSLIARGLCPRCRYELSGLPGSAVCPECSEDLSVGH
jgi:hypothetical protein